MFTRFQRLFTGHAERLIGIDIGTESVKLAEVSNQRQQQQLLAIGLLPIPVGLLADGSIADSKKFQDLLRQLLSSCGASARNVVLSLGSRSIFAREVLFPAMAEKELREAMKWNIEKYVPYEAGSYYYDVAIAGKTKSNLEMKVLLVAVLHSTINPIISTIKAIGLKPLAVEIESLASYRTLEGAANSVVIDLGSELSQITAFQQGSPAVIRTIGIGGRRFTEAIMHDLSLDYQDAEHLKQCQTDSFLQEQLPAQHLDKQSQVELVAGELIREVRRTIEYHQNQNPEASINNLFLTGGGAKLKNLSHYIASQLDLPVQLHQPLRSLVPAGNVEQERLNDLFPQLAVAIGLALRGGEGK
jgi:type IV pilus assembly protein PilM